MKHMKRLLSMVLALVMVLGLCISVSAEEATSKIIIDDGNITGASYGAFRLLLSENAPEEDGSGSDKFVYTVNTKYRAALMSALGLTGTVTDGEIIDAIAALEDDGDVQAFANDVYALIKDMDYDATTNDNVFHPLYQGYYLIVEDKLGSAGENMPSDTFSLVMLDTAGLDEITVKTKEKTPTVTKQVEEVNDSEGTSSWGDSADHDIKDIVNFQVVGTVSDKYEYYNEYGYKFKDTMQQGLTMQPDSLKITIGSVDVTNQFLKVTSEHGFEAYANLKDLTGVTVTAGTQVVVTYQAELNENALLGASGNRNSVVLYYENDPYAEDYGEIDPDNPPETPPTPPGETPPAVTIVFTFEGTVNKVDKDGNALKGAGFTLYKWYKDENDWVAVGSEIKLADSNVFSWEGLDAGEYKLVETTVPTGYNKAADLLFEVEAEYNEGAPDSLKKLVIRGEDGNTISEGTTPVFSISSDFVFTTDIVNLSGAELPETGGMGTTLIYAVGGILFAAAVVLLVTKKRMASEE